MNNTNLPTAEEYREMVTDLAFQLAQQKWSEPKYQCPKCDGGMCRDNMNILTSLPPQYKYKCNKCGHVEFQYK